MYTVKRSNRVHRQEETPQIAVSTAPNPKKILRQLEAAAPSSIFSAAFGGIDKDVFSEIIVAYYNGEAITSDINKPVTQRILRKCGIDWTLFKDFERMAVLLLQMTDRFRLTDHDPSDEESRKIRRAAQELQGSLRMFRAAMKWLCSPKEMKRAVSSQKLRKWPGTLEAGRYPLIDRENEQFVKYFEDHGLKHLRIRAFLEGVPATPLCLCVLPRYHHFIDLFCAFLVNECAGKAPSEMPFKVCRQCEKLFSPQRLEAEFCSDDCRRKNFWTPERHRDYTYVSRIEEFTQKCTTRKFGYSDKDLQDKLQESGNRLQEIENRWCDWPKIIEKIKKIKQRSAA